MIMIKITFFYFLYYGLKKYVFSGGWEILLIFEIIYIYIYIYMSIVRIRPGRAEFIEKHPFRSPTQF